MATFEVYGNWGRLTCDAETGFVLEYDKGDSDWEKPGDGYEDITRIDVLEWKSRHLGIGIENAVLDIIHVGFWTHSGKYEAATPEEY